jgi:hypothetical protein
MSRLHTIEIKSSRIPDRDYIGVNKNAFSNIKQQKQLLSNLKKRDIFVYPKFTRSSGEEVHNFNQYCNYVRANFKGFFSLTEQELMETIIDKELEEKCKIYTRIFIDKVSTDSILGYLTGYALSNEFFLEPRIINMPRKNKSENALYYVYPIKECKSMLDIFKDNRLWG